MARDPGSLWAPLPEAGEQGTYVKTQFIVHSTGDRLGAAATARYFAGVTPNESTFVIGYGPGDGRRPDDPTLQLLDTAARADANVAANRSAIAVEVAGLGTDDFTDWQLAELVRLGVFARAAHPGIAGRVIDTPTGAGFGWHVMFGAPGPWAAAAKVCPGPLRIQRLRDRVFPAIFATDPAAPPAATPTDDEDDEMFRLYTAKGDGTVYFGGPGVWMPTPNTDWMTTAHLTIPSLQLVQLPTPAHLEWARTFCLEVLTGKQNR